MRKFSKCRYAANELVERGAGKGEVAVITDEPVRHFFTRLLPRLCTEDRIANEGVLGC